jgi:hypothetical protein
VPVSTIAASPPLTSTYAETKPRFARCQVTPPVADEGGELADPSAVAKGCPDPASDGDGSDDG